MPVSIVSRSSIPQLERLIDEQQQIKMINSSRQPSHIIYQLALDSGTTDHLSYLGSLLADLILNDIQETRLRKIIDKHYYYFEQAEKEDILRMAVAHLNGKQWRDRYFYYQDQIVRGVVKQLGTAGHINIDGFLLFMMRNYLQELRDIVDLIVENFVIEAEFQQFIYALKPIVNNQQPLRKSLHVFAEYNGDFSVVDEDGSPITPQSLAEFPQECLEQIEDDDDLLFSTVIAAVPAHVTIHHHVLPLYARAVSALGIIYEDRISFCHYCAYCRYYLTRGICYSKDR